MKQLDPQVRALLERAAQAPLPPLQSLSPAQARAQYRSSRAALRPPAPDVAAVRDRAMPGPGGALPLRLYRGLGTAPEAALPAVVYFHGGGWVVGDLDTHDTVCRLLANAAQCAVVAVDYRLAPEHRFPAAVDDAIAAVRWVGAGAGALGIDPACIAVAGESAGANLAAVAAIALRDMGAAGGPPLAMQLLVYPVTDHSMDWPSATANGEGYMLSREDMLWYSGHYLRDAADGADWRASPLRAADFSRLPPAYVMTAGFDPLLDQGLAYAEAMRAAGVDVTYECFEGQIHAFLGMGGVLAASQHAIYRLAQGLTRELARAAAARDPGRAAARLLRP
jgi:acetyl esterase